MVAVVNRHVVLQSELEQEVRVDFLLRGLPVDQITQPEMQAMLERLIDQSLLQQQIAATAMLDPTPEELAASLARLRSQIPGAQEDAKWQSLLAGYGLGERDLEVHIASQMRILRYVDLRFRSLTRVDRAAVGAYYQDKFLPERRAQGLTEPPLSEVFGQIERLLADQQINDSLAVWLATLRSQANIQKLTPVSVPAVGAKP
jgi:hypothetical protein